MSDLPVSDHGPADGGNAPSPLSADPPSPAPEAPAPVAAGTPEGGDPETFPRDYVETLRQEAAEHRVKAREASEALERYAFLNDVPDEAREIILQMNQSLVADPTGAGAAEVLQIIRRLTGDDFDKILEQSQSPQYLTREEAEKVAEQKLAERDRQRIAQEAEKSLWSKITSLGFERDTPDTGLLLWYAHTQHDGDVEAAAESVKAFRQQVIDSYVNDKRGKNSKFPPVSGATVEGPAVPDEDKPKSVSEASDLARAFFASRQEQAS